MEALAYNCPCPWVLCRHADGVEHVILDYHTLELNGETFLCAACNAYQVREAVVAVACPLCLSVLDHMQVRECTDCGAAEQVLIGLEVQEL